MAVCFSFVTLRGLAGKRISPVLRSWGRCLQSERDFSSRIHIEKPKDLYAVLGVSPAATQQQVKEAYYALSMKYHPDRNRGSDDAHQRFTDLTEAYSVLGQYESRKKYDKGLLQEFPHQRSQPRTTSSRPFKPKDTTHFVDKDKVKFNFDEFYRAHYGEALKRQRKQKKEYEEEQFEATFYRVPESTQQAWTMGLTLSLLFFGALFIAPFERNKRSIIQMYEPSSKNK